jgi:hypothetical protein
MHWVRRAVLGAGGDRQMDTNEQPTPSARPSEPVGTKRIAFVRASEEGEYRPLVQQLDGDSIWRTIWECPHIRAHNWTMAHSCAANSVEGDNLENIVVLP